MATAQIDLKPGTWLVSDCGKVPSDSNCQMVLLAPADQKADLIEAGVQHMVAKHGHTDGPELRDGAEHMLQTIEVS